jgi:DNA adenine methylase
MTVRKVEEFEGLLNTSFEPVAAKLEEKKPFRLFPELPQRFPRSPLRYPGGKNRAIKAIYSWIPEKETQLCSPFLGGGSIELACTTRMKVWGADIFEPLVDFWQVLLKNPDQLADQVLKYHPLSRTRFYDLQKHYIHLKEKVERAAAFFVLNRSSFSGTTLSGGMSPGHPRFTPSAIERLRSFRVQNFEVECADFRDVIPKHVNAFLYLDPPYMNGQALYGVKGDVHKEFDHRALAELLRKRERWILSYNDGREVRELYSKYCILSIEWNYGMSKDKQSREILILSPDLVK